jgi:ribosome-interacting GTPase 1
MPANLSPEYKDAQEAYRKARDPAERLACLHEMLRTIPRHKGTEHLQADIKTRIKELSEELGEHKKAGGRGPAVVVRPEGAGQAALLGPPNAGKSSLHARLTGSHAAVGPYPFATKLPLPGMLPYQDIHFQLVDLPPLTADYVEPWLGNTLETADAVLLVLDLGDPDCVDQVTAMRRRLEEKRITLLDGAKPDLPGPAAAGHSEEEIADPFRLHLPAALLANKGERLAEPEAELATFCQLACLRCPALIVSAETGLGLEGVGRLLFDLLGVVRVYTKVPGHPAEKERPFTLRSPATARDVARLVHRGRAEELKFARLWGSAEFDGQQVSPDHPVRDGDVVELHW